MPVPEKYKDLPELTFGGLGNARMIWERRSGPDWDHGTLTWKSERYWFTMCCYDEEEELVRYSVYPLTPEETHILDDWYVTYRTLQLQWQLLANNPATSHGIAQREKARQLEAFQSTLPRFEERPVVAHFSVSD